MSMSSALGAIVFAFLAFAPAASGEDDPPPANSDVIPIKRAEPVFPRDALIKGISGRVRVHFIVLPDGSVADVRVVESRPPKVFDESAVRAVSKWQFKPKTVDGVAVEREAEQTINYMLQLGEADELIAFAGKHRDKLELYFSHLRALCPDRYAHADDAANAALRQKLPAHPRESLTMVEPKRQASADASTVTATEPCLFTSWEQLRDPEAFEVASYYIGFGVAFDTPSDSAAAFKAVADAMRAGAGAATVSEAQRREVRIWLFKRHIPAYYSLINAQATQYPPATATGAAAADPLDRAKAAMDRWQPKEARSILSKALKATTEPIDRALLLLALARTQAAIKAPEAALRSLDEATAMQDLPWNLAQTAEMARATLCGRVGNIECFESSRAKLHAELGLTEKFAF